MMKTYLTLLTVLVHSASPSLAFLLVHRRASYHSCDRVLLAQQSGADNPSSTAEYLSNLSPSSSSPSSVIETSKKDDDDEQFQRTLLEAKLAYDATVAVATTTNDATVVDDEVMASNVIASSTPEPEKQKSIIIQKPVSVVERKESAFVPKEQSAIVPINESTVQFTAGVLGAVTGLFIGGPILSIIAASLFNYLSRKEEDKKTMLFSPAADTTATTTTAVAATGATKTSTSAKKIVDTASQTVLHTYNYVAQFDEKNKVSDSIIKFMEKMVEKVKETDTPAGNALGSLESTLSGMVHTMEELNNDYDIVGGVGTVLESIGDLVEVSVDKVVELNEEYKFTDRSVDAVKVVVGKVAKMND